MTSEYNRDVCLFCPYLDECRRLRTIVECARCSASLICAETSTFNTPTCLPRAREWRERMPAAAGCLLAYQLLERHADFIKVESPEDPTVNAPSQCIRCPRCNNTTGGYTSSYDLNIESVFNHQQKAMNQQHRLWCNFCGLDVKRTFT